MAKRRKSKKSSLKGFITLLILVVGILYAVGEYYFPDKVHQAQNWVQEQISGATTTHSAPDSGVVINDGELVPSNYCPNVNKKITVLKNIGYISGFSNELRVPLWVGYVATYPFKYNTVERPSTFIQDTRVSGSATHHDYSNSGYDRGHMAPNYVIGRCYGEKAQMETFLMTNIIPQKPKLNRKQWKDLEQHIANILAKKYGKVLVFTGPVFENAQIDKIKGTIAIPTSCYMIIVVQNTKKEIYAIGFVIPQVPNKKSLWDYCVSIDEIERLTGIDFLPQLPDDVENAVESNRNALPFKN